MKAQLGEQFSIIIACECHHREGDVMEKAPCGVKDSLSSNSGSSSCCCVTQDNLLHLSEPHMQNGISDNYFSGCKV